MLARHFRRLQQDQSGFSLAELLVVIAIIAILAAIVSLSLGGLTSRATAARDSGNKATIQAAVDAFYAATSDVSGGPYYPTGSGGAGAIDSTKSDGHSGTLVPTYVRSMPSGSWAVDANGLVTGP